MATSHSPAFEPVCNGLKSVFDEQACTSMPLDLTRLLDALDDAFARGDLFPLTDEGAA
jgi:hypothetical protein